MAREVFVAMFRTRAGAETAKRDLEAAGIPAADMSIRCNETADETTAQSSPSFFEWLFGSGAETDRRYYGEHFESGRAALSIMADSAEYGRIAGLLQDHDLVRENERTGTSSPGSRAGKGETVIPTAKEELEVGKQQASDTRGYRIRRYVVENPVEQQVALHDETVRVERRAPTQARAGERPFEERYVEVTETHEEPVVRKVVKPGEEVVVQKQAQDRTETVRDTVRESKVEVDKAAAADKPSQRR